MKVADLPQELRDPLWRLRNLYSCRVEGIGKPVKFIPRPEQEYVLKHLIEKPKVPLYIIKSRRLGISTCVDTFQTDCAAFTSGFRGIIIDLKQADATKKMVEIVRFAFDSLPPAIRSRFQDQKRNDGEMRFRLQGEEENQDSVIFATTGGRGGDCSMLHVSEMGPIAATDPTRAKEIRTGAFPAARLGRRVVETTWYGGKGGDLWDLVKPILEKDPNAEGEVVFFPWHHDPAAIRLEGLVTSEIEEYFRELTDKLGRTFAPEQKKWYAAKKLEQGIFVKREYPSTLEEALSAPVEGSIYGDTISEIRGKGQILPFEWNRDFPVFSVWDLGWADSTTVWFVQQVGLDYHWIRHLSVEHRTAAEVAQWIRDTGIPVAGHIVPHDAGAKRPGDGKNYRDAMVDAGLVNIMVVPVCRSIWPGIDRLRSMLRRSFFCMPHTEGGVMALEAYHVKSVTAGGLTTREPVHDWSSHSSSAARIYAEAQGLGLINTAQAKRTLRANPRYPDGSVADMEYEQEQRNRRGGRAMSGHSAL